MNHLAPDYLYTPQGLETHKIVSISGDGHIAYIADVGGQFIDPSDSSALRGIALLPGYVNAHSHVFQRALRGHTHRPFSNQDTFWTWRRAMFAEAQRLNPDLLYESALRTYREMLVAGYTSVGEFHYVHHQPGGQPYANPNSMSEAILQAGPEAGIRSVFLIAAYAQPCFHTPPQEHHRHF